MPDTRGIPIRTCKDREDQPNPKYKQRDRPKRPNHGKLRKDLEDWGDAWGHWINSLAKEIGGLCEHAAEKPFDDAVEVINQWGEKMRKCSCDMLEELRGDALTAKEGGVIADSTQPPPSPFKGGGRSDSE